MDFYVIGLWFMIVIILILMVFIIKFHIIEKFSSQVDERGVITYDVPYV